MSLDVGGLRLELIHVDIHSDDAAVIWLPGDRLLLAGDTLEDTVTYFAEPDGLDRHLADLERLWTALLLPPPQLPPRTLPPRTLRSHLPTPPPPPPLADRSDGRERIRPITEQPPTRIALDRDEGLSRPAW